MSTPRILVIGEALMDIVTEPDGTETEHVGARPPWAGTWPTPG